MTLRENFIKQLKDGPKTLKQLLGNTKSEAKYSKDMLRDMARRGQVIRKGDTFYLASQTTPAVDWEKLAKQLQQALAMEIKENDELKSKVKVAETTVVQLGGIISYLEGKLWTQSSSKA